jgi:o-succinylbenzoate---CoA ligase
LVAIDLPGGDAFVRALLDIWSAGDAAFPIDRRLPPPAREATLRAMGVDAVVTAAGETRRDGHGAAAGDALVLATSGSTGTPKGVVLSHDAVAAAARATTARLAVTVDDTWLACLPLSHAGGLGVVTRALLTGTPLVVHDGFDAARVAAAGATAVSLVGTALARVDPGTFRVVVLGGGQPPDDLPPNVFTTYGLTETGGGVVYDGMPLEGVEVVAADGELLIRSPMQMRCYRDGTSPIDGDGWLHTGDLGHVDADGRVHVRGRRAELIITGGENVWPEAVEAALRSHPDVDDAAVTGEDDAEWGQRIVAIVVPADAAAPPALDSLKAHVRLTMPAFAAPKEVRYAHRIPRTTTGKVARGALSAAGSSSSPVRLPARRAGEW